MRLLVADHHEEFRRSLVEYVRAHRGLKVVGEARDGVEAVRMTKWTRPDIVLMNVGVRKLDAWTAAKAIKLLFPQIRVIAISLDDDPVSSQFGMSSVIDAVLKRDRIAKELPKVIARIRSEIQQSAKEAESRKKQSSRQR